MSRGLALTKLPSIAGQLALVSIVSTRLMFLNSYATNILSFSFASLNALRFIGAIAMYARASSLQFSELVKPSESSFTAPVASFVNSAFTVSVSVVGIVILILASVP